jgi:hypothetical protein
MTATAIRGAGSQPQEKDPVRVVIADDSVLLR